MAKIFCIEFPALAERHIALVSIYTKEDNPYFHIQFTDPHLKSLFAAEHIRYEGEEGYKQLDFYKSPFTRQHLLRIVGAIRKTICTQPAVVRWLLPFLQKDS